MAELRVDGEELVVHLTPLQKAVSFHLDIRVPLSSVRSVRAVGNPWMALRGRRMAGTVMRGVAAMGTWIHGDRLYDFNILRGQQKAVQVEVNTGRFERFIIGVPDGTDPEEEAQRIAAAAGIRAG